MTRRPAVIAYDISSDSTRRRIYRILLEWRLDGQKSVHECVLSPAQAQELFMQLGSAIDRERDRLLLAWVTPQRPLLARGVGRIDAFFERLVNIR
ncbi:MAG: CRISPR-associated endonuclease Cas2 [Pseudomonadota bacterium]|nr:CRISPR-associated endonuclease Cas2 [Pseudomonadota bacterium]